MKSFATPRRSHGFIPPRRDSTCHRPRSYFAKGFTFVELLITMAILAIVSTLFLSNFKPSLKRARDTQRKSDLAQYRIALENYAAANNGLYPPANFAGGSMVNICNANLTPAYIASCPQDPFFTGASGYYYHYDAISTDYALWAQLNNLNYWRICSDGRIGEVAATEPHPRRTALCP